MMLNCKRVREIYILPIQLVVHSACIDKLDCKVSHWITLRLTEYMLGTARRFSFPEVVMMNKTVGTCIVFNELVLIDAKSFKLYL